MSEGNNTIKDWVNALADKRQLTRDHAVKRCYEMADTLMGNNRWTEAAGVFSALTKICLELDGETFRKAHEPKRSSRRCDSAACNCEGSHET